MRLENRKLKASCAEVNDRSVNSALILSGFIELIVPFRYDSLSAKFKQQRQTLDVSERKLQEATKANERLAILSSSLNQQLTTANKQLASRERQLQHLDKRSRALDERATNAVARLAEERLEKQRAMTDFEQLTLKLNQERMAFEEKVKAEHALRLTRMDARVAQLEKELARERESHARDLRGLQHLRTHFASLPYSENSSANMVVEDQLKEWTT